MALLEATGICKRFGGISALVEVSLAVEPGQVVGLIGPNGAGKTTLFQCLSGLARPDAGCMTFADKRLDGLPVHERCRLGIRRTFQKVELFSGLSVRTHVLLAGRSAEPAGVSLPASLLGRSGWSEDEMAVAEEALAAVGLDAFGDAPVESLDLGRGRLLELARALVGRPRLLLLDEPSSGLGSAGTEAFARIVGDLRRTSGVAVLLVEHDLDLVAQLADVLVVLDFGRVIATGSVDTVLADPEVRIAYLGARTAQRRRTPDRARVTGSGPAALELSHIDAGYGPYRALFDVSFSVRSGSVTALLGPNGAGKTTVARVVAGLVRPSSGTLLIAGEEVHTLPAWRIARLGTVLLPEGRSVFASLSVEENLTLTFGRGRGRSERRLAIERAYDLFPRLRDRRRQLAGTLSGGEQRILALARVLAVPPRLLVADELSLGLSPEVTDEVFEALRAVCDRGSTLLVIEQHVERVLELADDAVALRQGRVWAAGPAAEVAALVRAELATSERTPQEGAQGDS
ncbi:MAG: ATP-binding cassette domain-containing protein [Acidimicrobiales bacterium]